MYYVSVVSQPLGVKRIMPVNKEERARERERE